MDFNISNFSQTILNKDCSISWNKAIMDYCHDWKYYLTNYDFYIICIWVFLIAGIIGNFWNFKYYKVIMIEGYPMKIDFNLISFIREISMGAMIIRIFQLYYISKIYLGV